MLFKIGLWLDNRNNFNTKMYNNLKQLKTPRPNSPWAYIREGLLSKGFLRLRFGGLILGRLIFESGWGSQNFTVFMKKKEVYSVTFS